MHVFDYNETSIGKFKITIIDKDKFEIQFLDNYYNWKFNF